MTTPDQSENDRSRDQLLAGEYVLGVLPLDQRRRVEDRIVRDAAFAAMVMRWQENLSSDLDAEYGEERPPKAFTPGSKSASSPRTVSETSWHAVDGGTRCFCGAACHSPRLPFW